MKNLIKKLYSNIGDKVCAVAKVVGGIGCLAFIVGLIMLILSVAEEYILIFALIVLVAGLIFVIASWPLFAFGQITNDVRAIKTNLSSQTKTDTSELPEI